MDHPESTVPEASHDGGAAPPKRTRVLLSCAPCRASKLKCDRAQPCSQCLKKGRTELCAYAPKPQKHKPPRGMAARLKRLEGMVREMLDHEGDGDAGAGAGGGSGPGPQQQPTPSTDTSSPSGGQVVQSAGARGATYVGATHFMAMLDDIEDLKSYFDDPEEPAEDSPDQAPEEDSPELLMLSRGAPRSKDDLLKFLPERHIADRLVMRYFSSHSASQHIVHKTTFVKRYSEFWRDPSKTDLDWLALLYMVLALAIFFSSHSAPHELAGDGTPLTPMQRFKHLRTAAGWALTRGRYATPGLSTCAPFMLYVESEFLVNRASQMNCYLLSSVCIRIMLKMGLHRDPSKIAPLTPHGLAAGGTSAISPFKGEMRRRMWNLAIQIDMMVSFHMGLPSMIHGIESDTRPPGNLLDEDFDEESPELPPERPVADYTQMTYPIYKSAICRVFGLVARQAHALTLPTYAEVMRLDVLLEDRWAQVPPFMKVRPLDECITHPPFQVVQRFGIASLYQKSRCVLHRRYLVETPPSHEHDYSRRTCLLAALSLLEYQNAIFQATKPGGMLSQNGWFVSSLAMHDFLLAAMIVYIVVQNDGYSEVGGNYDWTRPDTPLPSKQELIETLKRSHRVWREVVAEAPEVKKAPEVLETMFRRIGTRGTPIPTQDGDISANTSPAMRTDPLPVRNSMAKDRPPSDLGVESTLPDPQIAFSRSDLVPKDAFPANGMESSWLPEEINAVDWNSIECAIRANARVDPGPHEVWMESENQMDEFGFARANFLDPDFLTE